MSTFKKCFPIISYVIDRELLSNPSINRDDIVSKLLDNPEINKELLSTSLESKKKHNTPEKAIGNIVDWFSAEITKQSKVSLPWVNKYSRRKIKHNGREIWEYAFSEESFANEIPTKYISELIEGTIKQISVNAYERSLKARAECIAHYGLACSCCGFDFSKTYGEVGQDFIHIHHLTLISELKKEYYINPVEDLRPVCPNCHAMIHRKTPSFSIDEIRKMINEKCITNS